jgi:hypothetical protein
MDPHQILMEQFALKKQEQQISAHTPFLLRHWTWGQRNWIVEIGLTGVAMQRLLLNVH